MKVLFLLEQHALNRLLAHDRLAFWKTSLTLSVDLWNRSPIVIIFSSIPSLGWEVFCLLLSHLVVIVPINCLEYQLVGWDFLASCCLWVRCKVHEVVLHHKSVYWFLYFKLSPLGCFESRHLWILVISLVRNELLNRRFVSALLLITVFILVKHQGSLDYWGWLWSITCVLSFRNWLAFRLHWCHGSSSRFNAACLSCFRIFAFVFFGQQVGLLELRRWKSQVVKFIFRPNWHVVSRCFPGLMHSSSKSHIFLRVWLLQDVLLHFSLDYPKLRGYEHLPLINVVLRINVGLFNFWGFSYIFVHCFFVGSSNLLPFSLSAPSVVSMIFCNWCPIKFNWRCDLFRGIKSSSGFHIHFIRNLNRLSR